MYTKYIIRVLKSTEVTPKGEVPTVEKTINDTLDGTYTEIQDFDIGDIAYYKWEGKLPSNLKSYETYSYKFTDTMPAGLKFLQFEKIYIEGHDGNVVYTFYEANATATPNQASTLPQNLPEGITATHTNASDGTPQSISVRFADLLVAFPNILETHKVVVKYAALITRNAAIARAMTNEVVLEFSNNPNGEGTGKTPKNEAHAFTFAINVDKYDADKQTTKLKDAKFVLYYERIEDNKPVKHYAQVITEEMIAAGGEINGLPVDSNDLGVVYQWTTNRDEASILDTDENGALTVRGLDEGIYYLEETEAPAGYNLMESPVQIKIIPTYTQDAEGTKVSVSYEVDSIAQSSNTVGVRNSSGSTLPSTGGIGTTIFYVLGGILAVGAVVLLVTKKRMRE